MDIELIKTGLLSPKIGDRRKSIKTIIKDNITALSDDVYNLFLIEYKKKKSWEIQCELIDAIGILDYKLGKQIIELICKENIEHDMITSRASGCYLRLSRINLIDIKPVEKLLSYGKFAVINGVLKTIGIDKMMFTDKEIESLILFVNKIPIKQQKGYSDIRIGLANACAGWEKSEKIIVFLKECINDNDSTLIKVAKNSLNGKYSDV